MNVIVIPPMPSITALAYELAHKAMLEGWDIKIDMNKGTVEHNIHCKPSVIAPNSDLGNHPSAESSGTHTDHPLRHWDRTCPACAVEPTTQVLEAE